MERRVSDELASSIMSARGAHAARYTALAKRAAADEHEGSSNGSGAHERGRQRRADPGLTGHAS